MTKQKNYEVGYGKPPKKHQFPKGKSGNPRGRPRRKKELGSLDISPLLDEAVTVTIRGQKRKITTFEANVRQLANNAFAGDITSIVQFFDLCKEFGVIKPPDAIRGGGVLLLPEGISVEEWYESRQRNDE